MEIIDDNLILKIPINSKEFNILDGNWPIYELWFENEFYEHIEFIPNNLIGIIGSDIFTFWKILGNYLLITDKHGFLQLIFYLNNNTKNFNGIDLRDKKSLKNCELKYVIT